MLCPRKVGGVEHVVQGGKWPLAQDEAAELCCARLLSTATVPIPPVSSRHHLTHAPLNKIKL